MDQQREKASAIAHEFVVYQESEQSDIKAEEKVFDALWQSIYDVCKLINFGIIDDITQEEFEEAYSWLKATQSLTEDYQDFELEFQGEQNGKIFNCDRYNKRNE